jgi:predicted branched-subunit amino acid permease
VKGNPAVNYQHRVVDKEGGTMKVLMMLIVMFSCSYAFGYQMAEPNLSIWYPIGYTIFATAFLSLPFFRR